MNILVLGNGFDLAHKLPTKYTDFLKFLDVIYEIFNEMDNPKGNGKWIDWSRFNLDPKLEEVIKYKCGNIRDNLFSREAEWKEMVEDNVWLEYFRSNKIYQRENWIDFENEISKVIQSIDTGDIEDFDREVTELSNKFFNDKFINDVVQYSQATSTVEQKNVKRMRLHIGS